MRRLPLLCFLSALLVAPAVGSAHAQDLGSGAPANATARASDESHGVAKKKRKKKHRKAKKAKHKKLRKRDGIHLHTEAASSGGYMTAYRERPADLGLMRLSGVIEPSFVAGGFSIGLPLELAHLQTSGALNENRASAELQGAWAIAKPIAVRARGGIALRDRPGWPDLYQPTPSGLLATDRYSSFTRSIGGGATVHPARSHWLRVDYAYRLADYVDDPAFEPIARPNHLTPFDYDRHDLEADYHARVGPVRVGAGVEAFWKSSFFVFARDARTGFTHAGPGGRAPNPLQALRGLAPFVELEIELLRKHLALELRYAHETQEDEYQGYYSFSAPNPRIALLAHPIRRLELTLAGEAWLRRYEDTGYTAGIGHPALDDGGDRRADDRFALELEGRLRVHPSVAFTLGASYTRRATNFPDYEPGVFPASQAYAIAWDYTSFRLEAGLELRKNWL